jgi:hypothetical protein
MTLFELGDIYLVTTLTHCLWVSHHDFLSKHSILQMKNSIFIRVYMSTPLKDLFSGTV